MKKNLILISIPLAFSSHTDKSKGYSKCCWAGPMKIFIMHHGSTHRQDPTANILEALCLGAFCPLNQQLGQKCPGGVNAPGNSLQPMTDGEPKENHPTYSTGGITLRSLPRGSEPQLLPIAAVITHPF